MRSRDDGGPYRQWRCACGTECGALQNRGGAWMLYPLEGFLDPDLIDRFIPRQSRKERDAAVEWWRRNAGRVERFRRGESAGGVGSQEEPRTQPPPPPPESRDQPRSRASRTPPPRARRTAPPSRQGPFDGRSARELLGVDAQATEDDIKRAYRAALKLCHPDRVAHLDQDIQEVAHQKSKALRRAYESLLPPRRKP